MSAALWGDRGSLRAKASLAVGVHRLDRLARGKSRVRVARAFERWLSTLRSAQTADPGAPPGLDAALAEARAELRQQRARVEELEAAAGPGDPSRRLKAQMSEQLKHRDDVWRTRMAEWQATQLKHFREELRRAELALSAPSQGPSSSQELRAVRRRWARLAFFHQWCLDISPSEAGRATDLLCLLQPQLGSQASVAAMQLLRSPSSASASSDAASGTALERAVDALSDLGIGSRLTSGAWDWLLPRSAARGYLDLESAYALSAVCSPARQSEPVRTLAVSGGVPREMRAAFWLSRLSQLRPGVGTEHRERYSPPVVAPGWARPHDVERAISAAKVEDPQTLSAIARDVRRTFSHMNSGALRRLLEDEGLHMPDQLAESTETLRRVLTAYAGHNPRVGYCQGMDHLAGLLLLHTDWSEEKAFTLLCSLMSHTLHDVFAQGMPQLQLSFYVLDKLIALHLPGLYTHLEEHEVVVSMFSTGWIVTLFSNHRTLGPAAVARVMDVFVVDGWKILFRTVLAVLREWEGTLLQCDLEGILNVFQLRAEFDAPIHDPDYLMERAMAFKVTRSMLRRLEAEVTSTV